MKAALYFLVLSVAVLAISATEQYEYEDEDEYEDDEDYELAPLGERQMSLFQLLEGLEELQHEMTMEKRGRRKGGKGRKGRKGSKGKGGSKIGPCWNTFSSSTPVYCAICNLKKPVRDMGRYVVCGGGADRAV